MDKFRSFVERVRPTEQPHEQLCEDEATYIDSVGKNRTVTDVAFLAIHGVAVLILCILVGYCIANGDINKFVHGYDKCGNTCGFKNDFVITNQLYCRAYDMTKKPYLLMNTQQCIERCDLAGQIANGYQCSNSNEDTHDNVLALVNNYLNDVYKCLEEIIGLSFLALGFAIAILMLLRYFIQAFVWTVLGVTLFTYTSFSAFLIYCTLTVDSNLLPATITVTFITIVLILIVLILREKIALVMQLLKEAAKSVIAMPLLLFQPLLTFVVVVAFSLAWFYCTLWIESAGIATEINGSVVFEQNSVMRFTYWYNIFMALWIIQFVYGCQNLVTAGAVSKWYFTRNKNLLKAPIFSSAIVTFKYHLGTVSAGSLSITLIRMLRILLRRIRGYLQLAVCCPVSVCMGYIEGFVNYLTRNAYVVVAIHGCTFYQSGARAFKLITNNITGVIALNSVGDFVLAMAKLLVVFFTVLCGYFVLEGKEQLSSIVPPLTVLGIVAFLITHCFLSIYEMAIDTMFICFCEDSEVNDGITRPYYMSRELMEFVDNAKKVLKIGFVVRPPVNGA